MTIHRTPRAPLSLREPARPARATRLIALALAAVVMASCRDSASTSSAQAAPSAQDTSTARPGDHTAASTDAHADAHAESNAVTLSEAAFRTAQIDVQAVASVAAVGAFDGLEVPGQAEVDPRRVALVSSRIAGRIERLSVVEGDRVRAGEAVAALFSAEYLTAQVDLAQATRRVRTLVGTADETGARALADAAARRLRLLGATEADVGRATEGGDPAATLSLRAPIAGSIIESHVLPGGAVEAGAPVFTVADLSVIDVVAEIPERSLPQVRTGQRATVRIAAFPEMRFDGHVERLREALNPETRTLRAVIHVPNASRRLRPGMFASVRLEVAPTRAMTGGASRPTLTIPESAIVTDGERRFVFVETGVRTYARREVRTTPLSVPGASTQRTAIVVVQDGLRVGERVVVRGAFTLKSELAKASLSDEH
jgi:RND family efflux transporter MFP subunit